MPRRMPRRRSSLTILKVFSKMSVCSVISKLVNVKYAIRLALLRELITGLLNVKIVPDYSTKVALIAISPSIFAGLTIASLVTRKTKIFSSVNSVQRATISSVFPRDSR